MPVFFVRLRGDVVVSGAWGTFRAPHGQSGSQRQPQPAHISGGTAEFGQPSAINEDTTFGISSFNDSTDVTLSRLIRESSSSDASRQTALEQQYGRAHRSASTSQVTGSYHPSLTPKPEMVERRQSSHAPSLVVTPKLTRALSDTDVFPDQRILRSALRGSRTSPVADDMSPDDQVPTTPRKVSFAIAHASQSSGGGSESTAPLSQYASGQDNGAHEDESIVFRSQTQLLSPQVESPLSSPEGSPDEPSAADPDTQPQEKEAAPVAQATRRNVSLTSSGGVGGVGMSGDFFRKFAGWAQNSLSPLSPITNHAALPTSDVAPAQPAALGASAASSGNVSAKGTTLGSMDSSQSNISLSPVKTEPMRSQILSNFTTPVSGKTKGDGSPLATPTRSLLTTPTQSMPRRNSQTPSRSVNPLTRHLARKAILSAPSGQRGLFDRSAQSQNTTPTRGGQLSSLGDVSSMSGLLNISDIQREFDGFANMLQHDASAAQADILESEEAWQKMQHEQQELQKRLASAESERDFYQRQAEEVEKERLEWEQERQQLANNNHELLGNIDMWRKRIGDAESERQGVWNEDMQSRSELLHAIARLEDEVADSRVAHAQLVREHAKLEAELIREQEESRSVHQELLVQIDEATAESDRVDAENRQMQAELHEAQSRCADLEHEAQSAEAARRKAAMLETERAGFAAKHAGAMEHVNRLEQQLADAEQMELAAIKTSIGKNMERLEKARKEQRYWTDILRDALVNNGTLRAELKAIVLRRGDKRREMKPPASRAGGDLGTLSDDGNASTMSMVTFNNVPSTSQLIDSTGTKYWETMDQHLDEMSNLIDSSTQPPANATPQRRGNSTQAKKTLTPIKEEFAGVHDYDSERQAMRDAGTQCDFDGALEAARAQVYGLEDECRVQRLAVASAKQERDQFKAAQEEAAERIAQLSVQIEDLGEDQERMRADHMTTARIALRVSRQLAVLNSALARLAPRDALRTAEPQDEDEDDALAAEEDDAMIKATIDRPLHDGAQAELTNDEALEQVGVAVSEAYVQAKRLRRDVVRVKRERARLMKRLAEEERSKLPSYELSAQWGLKVRSPMRPAQTVRLLDDMDEPPPSLFLPDESAVMAEVAAARRRDQLAAAEGGGPDDSRLAMVSMAALRDPTTAAAELSRMALHVHRLDRQLRGACADRDKLEEFNSELVQKLDRANAERVRAQQECNAMSLRTSATISRATSRAATTTTPTRGTDWDDLESIKREMDRSSRKNKAFFENVVRLCRVLNQHTIDRTLADYGSEPAAADAQPENVYCMLLLDMADAFDARADLDDRMSIRANFASLAAAVRRRLGEKEAQLKLLRAELSSSRKAVSETGGATDDALRRAKRGASELETQLTEAHEQLTQQQANVRSLNDNISRLRQQCVAADSDLQEARLERDGWHQQYLACEQTLNYQIEENDRLSESLKKQGQRLRTRTTEEFVVTRQSYGDRDAATVDWDRLRAEWSAAVRQEDAEIWRNKEFLLRQACGSQLDMYRWALKVWADVARGIVAQSTRDSANDSSGAKAEKTRTLQNAVGELESQVEAAVGKTHALHERQQSTPSGGKTNRANFVESLSQIAQDLTRHFAGSWRDNVRSCIVAIASSVSAGTLQYTTTAGHVGLSPTTSTTTSSSGSGSPTFPRVSEEQKSMIREHIARREEKLKRDLHAKLRAEAAESRAREDAARAEFVQEKSLHVAECKYLRAKIQIEADRLKSVGYQNNVLMQLLGGHEGMMRHIDQLVGRRDPRSGSSGAMPVGHSRCRQMCRRVLFAVRLKNRLAEILAKTRQADAIKDRALRSRGMRPAVKHQSSSAPPPLSQQHQYAQHYQPQQLVGLRSTPITPSRLRNRSSELRSSSGSSFTQ
ncbi:hypothetical protein GGI20_003346 [Coemansia sp. BCRC 34301]|nr:hypothetical protein GGI20_003346 [Coemansia sp. BCRC 34301]